MKPTETIQRGALARYEGGVGTQLTEIGRDMRRGNKLLQQAGVKVVSTGRRGGAGPPR